MQFFPINCDDVNSITSGWSYIYCLYTQSTDSHEALNPLLDTVEHLDNGVIILCGNMTLISLNLACKFTRAAIPERTK